MKHKTLFILLLVIFILAPLFVTSLINKTFAVMPTATAKCLYSSGAGGDCGSCTCTGVGDYGVCTTTGFKPAGCIVNNYKETCHNCNIPSPQ